MSRICIAPVVEGHGDVAAARILLQRVWAELLGGDYAEVLQPFRIRRDRVNRQDEMDSAIGTAALKLAAARGDFDRKMILVLFDADDDCPAVVGPAVLQLALTARSDVDVACVVANVNFESWFVAAAGSLARFLDPAAAGAAPAEPERARAGKGWIKDHFTAAPRYSETADQPRLTSAMDLRQCRSRCPSFDKLCRELEKRLKARA